DAKPPIRMTKADHDRLLRLVEAADETLPDIADYLAAEVDRAEIVEAGTKPPGLVFMGSRVAFRDRKSDQAQTVTLVYPEEADMTNGRMSVLTPVGAALIGLSEGQSITWTTRTGEERQLE